MRGSPGKIPAHGGRPPRGQGRSYPLEYLLTLPLIAGMAGDGELDAAAEWAATAPEDLLPRLGAALGRNGQGIQPRQPQRNTT